MLWKSAFVVIVLWGTFFVNPTLSMERHIKLPRVPSDKIDKVRALLSPVPDSPDMLEQGKGINEGNGICFYSLENLDVGMDLVDSHSIPLLEVFGIPGYGDIGSTVNSFGHQTRLTRNGDDSL